MKQFSQLSEQEILALAISLEEDDARIYSDYAKKLEVDYPASAKIFVEMAREEGRHRARLLGIYRKKFGEHIPLLRRQDVKGFINRRAVWLIEPLSLDKVRKQVEVMEYEARRFYEIAMQRAEDASVRKLLGDLAEAERGHESLAGQLEERILDSGARNAEEETRRRVFVLRVVQPGLAGLMDGSVSTLAPLFAAAFATHSTWETFLVGLAASVGAGISMGFAEALSDDGSLTGRGHPLIRGIITGAMTALGGLGHTLPFLIENFRVATTVAFAVVAVELWVIAWIRSRYMDTPFLQAAFEVVLGGVIVFAAGILIGSA